MCVSLALRCSDAAAVGTMGGDVHPRHAALLRAFDYGAATCFGAAAAIGSWALVPSALPVVAQMLLGMVAGVGTALPALGLASWLLGGFEILVLFTQVGMVAGMVGAMTASDTTGDVAFEGMIVGLLVQLLLHLVDRSLRGEVSRDRGDRT